MCTLESKSLDRWRRSSQSHTILFFADEKRLISRMRELQNPKMVNEISFESLRGPITPRRANGRVIFLISPRKKSGKFFVCALCELMPYRTARSIPYWPTESFSIIFRNLRHLMVKPQTGYFILSNCIFVYAEVCFCVRRDSF